MIDWNALLQAIVASGVVAAGLSVVFQAYFDRKLKQYEIKLAAATELRTQIGKDRIEEYKKLSALVSSARKRAVDLSERKTPKADEISELASKVKALENLVYEL